MTMNSGFLKTGFCLSNAPCDWPERVTEVHSNIINLHNCTGENDFNHSSLGEMLISRYQQLMVTV